MFNLYNHIEEEGLDYNIYTDKEDYRMGTFTTLPRVEIRVRLRAISAPILASCTQ